MIIFASHTVFLHVLRNRSLPLWSTLDFLCHVLPVQFILMTITLQGDKPSLRIGATFPRFQEYYTITIQENVSSKDAKAVGPLPTTTGRHYVGKYFTSKGEFDEVRDVIYERASSQIWAFLASLGWLSKRCQKESGAI